MDPARIRRYFSFLSKNLSITQPPMAVEIPAAMKGIEV